MNAKIENEEQLERFLITRIAELLSVPASAIDPEAPHADNGLDSASAVLLIAELEDALDIELSPSLAWDHPSLRSIVEHVARRLPKGDQ
jgi:acyl carrier protein